MNDWPLDNPPIILLGTHRSGTTWTGDLLGSHPDIAYWVEPRHIWTRGNAKHPDDRLTAAHATGAVKAKIRAAFADYAKQQGKAWFCEKTPSNCLRVPFLLEVFPEAKVVFIVRDGRSVLRSTGEIMDKGVPTKRIVQRALQTPPTEWPAQAGKAFKLIASKFGVGAVDWWGPMPEGWREKLSLHRDERLAWQWARTISTALDDVEKLPEGRVLQFRYEDMAQQPAETITRVAEHIGLPNAELLAATAAESARPASLHKWKNELDDETLERVRPYMEPTLERLGYTWQV